jgi:hypothetical protein
MADDTNLLTDLLVGVTFYCHAREDGGVRMGIMLGPATVHEFFHIDGEEFDLSLIRSIELRCNGEGSPNTPGAVDEWLLSHSTMIRDGFLKYAKVLQAADNPRGDYPLTWAAFPNLPAGESMEIFCTAQRRMDSLHLAKQLESLGGHWEEILDRLLNPIAGIWRG